MFSLYFFQSLRKTIVKFEKRPTYYMKYRLAKILYQKSPYTFGNNRNILPEKSSSNILGKLNHDNKLHFSLRSDFL